MHLLLLLRNWIGGSAAPPAVTGPSVRATARRAIASSYSRQVDTTATARQAIRTAISQTPDIP